MVDAGGSNDATARPGAAAGEPVGRREANKRATRQALQDAAERLFAERGVLQTTVREIADAAGVTERTFFRYFRSKEDLLIRDAFAWMPAFQQAVIARPAGEPPLLAVRRALTSFMGSITRTDAASPLALFAVGAPADRVGLPALAIMRKLEADLADAIEQRLASPAGTPPAPRPSPSDNPAASARFRAEVIARVTAAVFRSAMLYDAQLARDSHATPPTLTALLNQAFDALDQRAPAGARAAAGERRAERPAARTGSTQG